MSLLRLWVLGSVSLLGSWLVYEYAPILMPIAFVTICLAGLTAVIVWLTRRFAKPPAE